MKRPPQIFPEAQTAKKKKTAPFPFLLEALAPLEPVVKPMFSGYAIYVGDKVVFMLRDRPKFPNDNGLWIVFGEGVDPVRDLAALRKEFPSLRNIDLLHGAIKHWLIVPADGPNFETEAMHACDRVLAHDERFGRIPQSRRKRAR
jgi:hypothetical protein